MRAESEIKIADWTIYSYASLPSTQQYIQELAAEDYPEGIVMQALIQTKGKGRQGRVWTSPMGNLYMSVLLRPDCSADKAGQLSFVAAVALSEAIDTVLADGHVKSLKWPNDILVDNKKCAGILLESDLDEGGTVKSLAMGMGVNIHAPPEDAAGLQALSHEITVPVNKFRDVVIEKLQARYRQWKNQGFAPIRKQWLAQAHGLGQPITATIGSKEQKGIFRDIDENGALIMETPGGDVVSVSAGDVYFAEMQE